MNFEAKQIAPPKNWEEFETLCLQIFRGVWADPYAQKNGRRGQAQHGVDVFGSPTAGGRHGVQCKGKDQGYGSVLTFDEITAEIARAEVFTPALSHWIMATTAPRDGALQAGARALSDRRTRAGLFSVQVLAWEDLQDLIANDQKVIEHFYPEHAFELKPLVDAIRALPTGQEVVELKGLIARQREHPRRMASWSEVLFDVNRDLGPALLGQGLGPADAVACPRLVEVDQLLERLRVGYFARLVGEPGAGKSVTAYQVAHDLSKRGWRVWRLDDAEAQTVPLPADVGQERSVVIIDNAHLMGRPVLDRLEERANERVAVLSTHNVVEHSKQPPGALALDAKRAVATIAQALRSRPVETLAAVRRADRMVGERYLDVDLLDRIRAAERASDRPWQFCFILGGGWRRATEAATSARLAGADLVLAAAAARQLATRDAVGRVEEVWAVCEAVGLDRATFDLAVAWLTGARLLLSGDDLRCPHQHFAVVVLRQIIDGRDAGGRDPIIDMVRRLARDARMPLAGLHLLLFELRFAETLRWSRVRLLDAASLQELQAKIWTARDPEDVSYAGHLLADMEDLATGWPRSVLDPHLDQLGQWLSEPTDPAGVGLGALLNNVWNKDQSYARTLAGLCDPVRFAEQFSEVTAENAYGIAHLLDRLNLATSQDWRQQALQALDSRRLVERAKAWPEKDLWLLSQLIRSVGGIDQALMLEMVEAVVPTAARLFADKPFEAFEALKDVFWYALRVWHPLASQRSLSKAGSREMAIARRIVGRAKAETLAERFSTARRREFRAVTDVLGFLRTVDGRLYRASAAKIDWTQVEATIGEGWRDLDHEDINAICVAWGAPDARLKAEAMIARRAPQMQIVDPRIACIAPIAAMVALDAGAKLALARHMNFQWALAAYAVELVAEHRPSLLARLVGDSEGQAVEAFQVQQVNLYPDMHHYVGLLQRHAPDSLGRILDGLDPKKAEAGWSACLKAGGKAGRSAAVLVEAAQSRGGALGEIAGRLRKRFPKASLRVPQAEDPFRSRSP